MKKMEVLDFYSKKSTVSSSRRSKSTSHYENEITEENSTKKDFFSKIKLPLNFVPRLRPKKEYLSTKSFHLFNLDNDDSLPNESDEESDVVITSEQNDKKRNSFVILQKDHEPLLLKLLNKPKESQQRKSLFFSNINKENHDLKISELNLIEKEYQISSKKTDINDNDSNSSSNSNDEDSFGSVVEI